jgi:Ca2+-transporting ATPase
MMAIMVAGQVLIIFFGSTAFVVTRLNGVQWAISLVLGFMSIPVGILIRLFPDSWIRAVVARLPSRPAWLRLRRKKADEEVGREEGRDIVSAMFEVRDDLAFLKRLRGGRMAALSEAIASRDGKTAQTKRRSKSPMRSALGMPGLLAASIGAMSPAKPLSSGRSDD